MQRLDLQQEAGGLYFCSLPCWEAHLPMMRHRDAWAVEARAPERDAWEREQQAERDAVTS